MSARLQRQYPFDDAPAYDGAVPEPIESSDETRASGLTLPERAQAELIADTVRRLLAKHRGDQVKFLVVQELLRSAVG
jgi:hypothetical protein